MFLAAMTRDTAARLAACFVLGAVVGTLLDGIHAYGDVLSYSNPAFGRWAAFVPLEFGLLGLGVGLVTPALERLGGGATVRWGGGERLAQLVLFTILYLLTALVGDEEPVWLAVALLVLAGARLAFHRTRGDWIYVAVAAVLGPAAEALLSALGAFDYLNPDFAGIPCWLPGLWANGGFFIRRLIRPIVMPPQRTTADRW
jgi:hypothetical protein